MYTVRSRKYTAQARRWAMWDPQGLLGDAPKKFYVEFELVFNHKSEFWSQEILSLVNYKWLLGQIFWNLLKFSWLLNGTKFFVTRFIEVSVVVSGPK